MAITASLYLRVSVAREESDSLERQERDLRALAHAEGLEVVAVHRDEGVSGAAANRPAFLAWLADARERRAQVLLAWRFDRISREGLPAVAALLDVLKASEARLLTWGDRMDSTSAAFRLTAAVLSEMAYAEREAIRLRVTSRQAADRRNGRWTKTRPTGYLVREGRLVQHPEEAAIVRRIVATFLEGASLRSLASVLDAEGVPTPRAAKGQRTREGARWGLTSVRHVLASPVLAGLLPHGGGVARGDNGEAITVTDDPIIDLATHRRVLAALEARSALGPRGRRPAVGAAPRHALSGLLVCGACGGPLVFQSRARGAFRCQRRAHSPAACDGCSIASAPLETEVRRRVISRLAALPPGSPALDVVAERWLATLAPEDTSERRAALDAVAAAEALVEDLEAARYTRGEFPGQDGAARWERLYRPALARLEASRASLASFPPRLDVTGLLDAEMLRESLAAADAADDHGTRRDLYRLLVDRISVARGPGDPASRLTICWAGGDDAAPSDLRITGTTDTYDD